MKNYKYEGMTIANIRVISYDKDKKYKCECIECLNVYSINSSHINNGIKRNQKKFFCNCVYKKKKLDKINKKVEKKIEHIDPEFKGISYKYSHYKYRHNKKFKSKIISLSSFYELLSKPCYYCGKMPVIINFKAHKYVYKSLSSTIDRIDSSRGYESDNCLSCCNECNTMKSNLSYSDFIQHITNIYDHIYKNQKEKYLIKEVC